MIDDDVYQRRIKLRIMRPFKFFFMFSLGIIFFMFVAKFVVLALIVAAFMSLMFFVGRKMRYFFRSLNWDDHPHYHDRFDQYPRRGLKPWQFENDFFAESLERPTELVSNYRVIKIQ